jgi:hypothetical protein
MKQQSEPRVSLQASAADATTEIFVVDGKLRRLASGVGELEISVRPGIYKVRFRSGAVQEDKLVEVTGTEPTVQVHGPPVQFRSAAPIYETATSREYHQAAAGRESRREPLRCGSGSRLFLFARDIDKSARTRPWTGVSIRDLEGRGVADLSEGTCNRSDRFGALHLELDPGTYRLRVDTKPMGLYEMFVTTCPGWQTQVFTLAEDFSKGDSKVRRPSLRTASIFMARGGYDAFGKGDRLAELARQGLASGRKVVRAADLNEMLRAKWENPMLGIFGAHLLLLAPKTNHPLIKKVMGRLGNLIGSHADVEALRLRPGAGTAPADLQFPEPPMLRRSWDLIARGTRRRASLVPPGSPAELVGNGLLASSPWLMHRVETVADKAEVPSLAAAHRILEQIIERGGSAARNKFVEKISDDPGAFTPLEQSIASLAMGTPRALRMAKQVARKSAKGRQPQGLTALTLIRDIDSPASSIARSAASLAGKLGLEEEG